MMTSAAILVAVVVVVVAAAVLVLRSGGDAAGGDDQHSEPPPRAWASETVTPVMLGPRNKAPERVARRFVVDQGTFLALTMAQADGAIGDAERGVVLAFIQAETRDPDDERARQVLDGVEAGLDNPIQLENALDSLRALSSEQQRGTLIELLVQVARADGVVSPEELAFMQRVGEKLGLSPADVEQRITLG